MRLLTFRKDGHEALGVRVGNEIVDVALVAPDAPQSLLALIQGGPRALDALSRIVAQAGAKTRRPLAEIELLPPVTRPSKIVCVGLNYADHRQEAGQQDAPAFPGMFHKLSASLVGHGGKIVRPSVSEQLDFEGELAVVVGKRAHRVRADVALDHVFGYTILDDGSVRDYQVGKAVAAGKNFDASGAVGPEVVTADELPPGASGLKLETRLNGAVMQSSNTDRLIFNVARIIEMLSDIHALEPGDIIATGTCAGVGGARKPPVWLKAGDVLEIEIEKIGTLRNSIADELQ